MNCNYGKFSENEMSDTSNFSESGFSTRLVSNFAAGGVLNTDLCGEASLSGAFGGMFTLSMLFSALIESLGLLATAITRMHGVGGLEGWRWIFVGYF